MVSMLIMWVFLKNKLVVLMLMMLSNGDGDHVEDANINGDRVLQSLRSIFGALRNIGKYLGPTGHAKRRKVGEKVRYFVGDSLGRVADPTCRPKECIGRNIASQLATCVGDSLLSRCGRTCSINTTQFSKLGIFGARK
ncbi:hypothetical protein HanIR_Chr02g0072021 [Helianthus annuus]|nr:hypothetical protein HanIR_Chr02g0072021 [Helianthus annuus]